MKVKLLIGTVALTAGLGWSAGPASAIVCAFDADAIAQRSVGTASDMVANSQNSTLRAAQAAARCRIVKDLHPGGRRCGSRTDTSHYTIKDTRRGGATYHVFMFKVSVQESGRFVQRYCTTK